MDRCLFCDAPATRLCDYAIAMVDSGEVCKPKGKPPYRVTSMDAMLSHPYTCDAPFCDAHGRVIGHVCGKDADTIDHCAGCFGADSGPKGLLAPGAIDAIRKQRHAAYRRQRITNITKETP